jgi:hypothetical protein
VLESASITATEVRTAAIMIGMCGVRPTAVMTESSENTMSRSATWTSTLPSVIVPIAPFWSSEAASILWWIS